MSDDYQFDDVDTVSEPDTTPDAAPDATPATTSAAAPVSQSVSAPAGDKGQGSYASELFSKQIKAKFRTFFVDLKESANGKFVKISEKSHGRKSTIMMDAEDVPVFIEALQEVQEKL